MISEREKKNVDKFYDAVMSIETKEECKAFFEDVSTIKELLDMSARLEVASMLVKGKVFNEISRETGASSATISRVNKCLGYGSGGYELILGRIMDDDIE